MTAATTRLRASAGSVGAVAAHCLELETSTYPKPGLVSRVDTGSHDDMDAACLDRSAAILAPWFAALVEAGEADAGMDRLRRIGIHAERAMMHATAGINTHRGAIFGLGLLCAATGLRHRGASGSLGALVATRWGRAIAFGPAHAGSHGSDARSRYGAHGARGEAARGFSAVYDVGLPALARGRRLAPGDETAARVQTCMSLIAHVEDTNLLHRGGLEGLAFARAAASAFVDEGGVGQAGWYARAVAIHRAFVARRLSPGGSADLLAMTLFVDRIGP